MAEDFYQKEPVPGGEAKFIRDKDAAHELAIIEATMGRDKALLREQELKRQHETGLTDKERDTAAFNEGLVAKYLHAFSVDIGKDGKIYYDLKPVLDKDWQKEHTLARIVLTQEGILDVQPASREVISDARFMEIMDSVSASELNEKVAKAMERETEHRNTKSPWFATVDNEKTPLDLENNYIKFSIKTGQDIDYFTAQIHNPFGQRVDNLRGISMGIKKVEADHAKLEEESKRAVPTVAEALDRF